MGLRNRVNRRSALSALLLPVVLLFALVGTIFMGLSRAALYLAIWLFWLPRGKDVLFVWSESPIWHGYLASRIVPIVQGRAIVLDWSQRKAWRLLSLAVWAFHSFGGSRDFNPMAIIFRPFHRAKIFRFWPAFSEWKLGNSTSVEDLTQSLLRELNA